MMEGFGVHTFLLRQRRGARPRWSSSTGKPSAGVHSLMWEEAQLLGRVRPRLPPPGPGTTRSSPAPTRPWELGVQVFPDTPEQTFNEGIDLLDPTKIVPEELVTVQPIGMYGAHRATRRTSSPRPSRSRSTSGTWPPGIDVTDDPLLQTRLFSYVDTQLTRLGGPNFSQIPINRPHAPVNDMLRDGFHQHGDHVGVAPYKPNSLDGGCPFFAGADEKLRSSTCRSRAPRPPRCVPTRRRSTTTTARPASSG